VARAYGEAFLTYLGEDLKVVETKQYHMQNPVGDDLGKWTWAQGVATPFSDWPYANLLTEVFVANPKFRVMVANGYQDTQTTVGAAQYLVDQAPWPRDRVHLHFYQGGHMAYSVEDSLRRLTQDVRAFITEN
jgi:carboxypeptidase C (cathepsin A)